jgi:hypothetical protein
MAPIKSVELLQLRTRIVETFDSERWQELGVLTECSDIINGHDRLLRSLSWGDDDYSGNVLSVLTSIVARNPANGPIVRNYVDHGLGEELNVSNKAQLGPKVVFQPSVFEIPNQPMDPKLVAVMMPFDKAFNDVYMSIGLAAATAGLKCQRVSDVWEHSAIVQDIFSLIYRSTVVVCDFTGRNSNVFYEAGIAHTLGRHLVPITQAPADIPFDLQQHRYLHYLNNVEGRSKMSSELERRLRFLTDVGFG